MADAQPTMEMGSSQIAGTRTDAPTQLPPNLIDGAVRTAQSGPSAAAFRAPATPPDMQSSPSLPATTGAISGVTAWQTNKKVTALWTINEDRNSFVGIADIGWKKLSGPTETAAVALTMLAAHARAVNSLVTYREESDGAIHEMYVW